MSPGVIHLTVVLTDETVAFVPSRGGLSGQHAGLDLPEGLKDTLDVVIREVGVDRRYVDPVKGTSFLCQLINYRLSLADVTGPPNLQGKAEGKTQRPQDCLKHDNTTAVRM